MGFYAELSDSQGFSSPLILEAQEAVWLQTASCPQWEGSAVHSRELLTHRALAK